MQTQSKRFPADAFDLEGRNSTTLITRSNEMQCSFSLIMREPKCGARFMIALSSGVRD